ncbi:MAG TPA: hypothetical protein VFB66_01790 [Tepidisphaeraceae bacterium]|nr:hypothetical protein [Tepidisphaeraceae bacterium]
MYGTFLPPEDGSALPMGWGRAPDASESFGPQWEYATSLSQYNAVCCSRQAGKTHGATLAAGLVLAQPDTRVIYATLVRRNAKKLFWWPLLEALKRWGWDAAEDDANETDLMLWLPNGSFLQALSCEKMADLARIRGDQADLFLVDECQEPRDDVLDKLVTSIVPMMLAKRGGRLDLLGTVPEVEPCVFSERLDGFASGKYPGWRAHGWDCFSNPFMDKEAVLKTAKEAGLAPGHPIYEREVLGRRVKDPSKLAYEYDRDRNFYEPGDLDFSGPQWRHSLGLDLGFQDNDAIVVLSWNKDDPQKRLYQRYAWADNHQDVDQLAAKLKEVLALFPKAYVTGDHGGHGAVKVLETLRRRMGIVIDLKPGDVMASVGLVNDDLRTGRLLIESVELAKDMDRVARTVNPRTKRVEINKAGYHSDLTEALRYAHAGALHYRSKAPKTETPAQRRDRKMREHRKRVSCPY